MEANTGPVIVRRRFRIRSPTFLSSSILSVARVRWPSRQHLYQVESPLRLSRTENVLVVKIHLEQNHIQLHSLQIV